MYKTRVQGGKSLKSPDKVARGEILKSECDEDVVLRTRQEDSGVRGRDAARVGEGRSRGNIARGARKKSINI